MFWGGVEEQMKRKSSIKPLKKRAMFLCRRGTYVIIVIINTITRISLSKTYKFRCVWIWRNNNVKVPFPVKTWSNELKVICGKASQVRDLSGLSFASSARIRRSSCASHEAVWGSGDIALRFLNLRARRRWLVSFTSRLFAPEKSARFIHWKAGLVGPRSVLEILENKQISCPCRESNHDSSVASP